MKHIHYNFTYTSWKVSKSKIWNYLLSWCIYMPGSHNDMYIVLSQRSDFVYNYQYFFAKNKSASSTLLLWRQNWFFLFRLLTLSIMNCLSFYTPFEMVLTAISFFWTRIFMKRLPHSFVSSTFFCHRLFTVWRNSDKMFF